jgi:tRNA(adenine34) deaminase
MDPAERDEYFMRQALACAETAGCQGEVPVGAVLVREDRIIGTGYNLTRRLQDATAHAEMMALREAARSLGHWYFDTCTLYVTVEPCVMCSGAILLGRLGRLVYGTAEPKFGCCGSLYDLVEDPRFNHRLTVTRGVLAEECSAVMKKFFRDLRSGQ